jgi:hypothetical protein
MGGFPIYKPSSLYTTSDWQHDPPTTQFITTYPEHRPKLNRKERRKAASKARKAARKAAKNVTPELTSGYTLV